MVDIIYGWPGIQIQMLLDLVGVAEQMNNQAVSVRYVLGFQLLSYVIEKITEFSLFI